MKLNKHQLRQIIKEEVTHLIELLEQDKLLDLKTTLPPGVPEPDGAVDSFGTGVKVGLADMIPGLNYEDMSKENLIKIADKARALLADAIQNIVASLAQWTEISRDTPGLNLVVAVQDKLFDLVPGTMQYRDLEEHVIHAGRIVSAALRLSSDQSFRAELEAVIDEHIEMMNHASLGGLERERDQLGNEMFTELTTIIVTAVKEDMSSQSSRADQNLRKVFKAMGLD